MFGIFRPLNLLLIFTVQFTLWYKLCFVNSELYSIINFFVLSFSVIFTAAAGYVINDLFDVATDRINKVDKVFIERKISKKNALIIYYLLNTSALALSVFLLDIVLIAITIASIFLLYFYSKRLKSAILTGNLSIAILSALPVLEIYYHFKSNQALEFWAYALFAFFSTLLREIVKDKEDIEGDLKSGIKTFANSVSEKKLKVFLFVLNSCLILSLAGLLFYHPKEGLSFYLTYTLLMILPAIVIFILIFISKNKKSYSNLSLYIKIYMFIGLIRLWI